MLTWSPCARWSGFVAAVSLVLILATPAMATPGLDCGLADDGILESHYLTLEIPTDGWLLVEVESNEATPTWFDVVDPGCHAGGAPFSLDRGLEQGLLAVEPGLVALRYGSVDPESIDTVQLATHFVPNRIPQPRDGEEGDDTEAGNGEIVPKENEDDRETDGPDKDGEEGDDTEAGNGEIVPTSGSPEATWRGCIVGQEPFDDFGACPGWLEPGRVLRHRLGELRSSDRDHFMFEVERSGRVRISNRGNVPMKGTLLMADGRPLLTRRDEAARGLEIEAYLVAGTYLLRLEGLGDDAGVYEVVLETLDDLGSDRL